jgi:hypothetical protein
MDLLDFEIDIFAKLAHGRLARDPGFSAVQTIPWIGPILGAVLISGHRGSNAAECQQPTWSRYATASWGGTGRHAKYPWM